MAESNADQILLGIDLGTSRTMIMTDRGNKSIVSSVVGYPKDLIGIKLLGDNQVFGEDAVGKRSYLDLFMPLENGVLKEGSDRDLEAAVELLKYVIDLGGASSFEKSSGIIGVPARASIASKSALLNIAQEVLDMALVLSEPFLVAYELDKLKNAIIIDIGAGTTDICGMKGMIPGVEDQATILKGGDYIDDVLAKAISNNYPEAQITKHLAKTIKEKHGFVGEAPGEVKVTLRVDGKPLECDLTEEVRVSCETILRDILEQIDNVIIGFDPEDQEETLKNIYIAGGGSNIHGLDKLIMERMKEYGTVDVKRVDNPDFAGCSGGLKLAMDLPPKYWSQLGDMIGN